MTLKDCMVGLALDVKVVIVMG